MFAATAVVTVLLAALMTLAAVRKLSHRESVVRSYSRVGVPEDRLNSLAMILLAGAGGLILGLLWAPIGIAAAVGVTCYFAVAVAFHVRANDAKNLPTPLTLITIAVVALVLRILSL